jgi:DNA-binding MarR family transcriptional regulator
MSSVDDSERPGWEVGVRLLLASRALFDELHRRLAAAGHAELRPAHGYLLQVLSPDGATASEAAAKLGVTKQAVRLMLDELERTGYVRRGDDPDDGRRRPARLTPRGDDALHRSAVIFDELRDELTEELGGAEMSAGLRLLGAIDRRYGPAPLRPVW